MGYGFRFWVNFGIRNLGIRLGIRTNGDWCDILGGLILGELQIGNARFVGTV